MIYLFLVLLVLLSQAYSSFLGCSMGLNNDGCLAAVPGGRFTHLGHPELMNTKRIFLRGGPFTKIPVKMGYGSFGTIRFWRKESDCAPRCSNEVPMSCPSQDVQVCDGDINECHFSPCQNGGTCLNFEGGYNCTCKTGWRGTNCEEDVDECRTSVTPCQNGGTCQNFDGGYNCSCPEGWEGQDCETDINECNDTALCQNGGSCTNLEGGYNCTCMDGWQGDNCERDVNECLDTPCQNGGTCENFDGGYNCSCPEGWEGLEDCKTDTNECLDTPCQNGGTCQNFHGGYNCSCPEGWEGQDCETDTNECLDTPCQNGGTCQNFHGGYNCSCQEGWEGQDCETDVKECDDRPTPCKNDGHCSDVPGGYYCLCLGAGWTGKHCETDVNECDSSPCQHDGTCVNFAGGYNCNCTAERQGRHCETDFNECDDNPCQNDGICENFEGGYNCSCHGGWQGKNCDEDVNECDLKPCQNNGTCINYDGGYSCTCMRGWQGRHCEADIIECRNRPGPCRNDATCQNFPGGYNCSCLQGWEGINCDEDVDECDDSPCQNGGTCVNIPGRYICDCPEEWWGKDCEIDVDECIDRPCQNDGSCENFPGGYSCTCYGRWQGKNCEIEVRGCDSNPCQKGGTCENLSRGRYTCSCMPGWQGTNCERDVDECRSTPCQNDGRCHNFEGGYNCSCLTGWQGENCETDSIQEHAEGDVSLHCLANTFLVVIPEKLLTDHSNVIHLRDSSCIGTRSSNGDVVVESRYDGCGTVQEVDEGGNKIIYKNVVTDVVAPSFTGEVEIEVECLFDEDRLVSTNYTIMSNLRRSLSQTGEYDISFFLCTDDTFSEVQETPVFVERTKKIFLKAQMETQVSGLSLSGTRCWATPSDRSDDGTFTNLIQNGCPVAGRHVEIKSDVSPTSTPSFAFSALAAQPDLNSHVVYVHCKIRICEATHADACRPCCSGSCRQRRSSGLMLSHRLSQGPIIQEVTEHPGEVTWPLPAVVFLCVLSVLSVCGLAFVSVVLGFRRNSAKSTAAVGYSQF